jgi:hypothetical protein
MTTGGIVRQRPPSYPKNLSLNQNLENPAEFRAGNPAQF